MAVGARHGVAMNRHSPNFSVAFALLAASFCNSKPNSKEILNAEYAKLALAKVVNPNVLINLVSRRVRQLTTGSGASSRPLLADTTGMGAGDIALLEIIEGKMGWDLPPELMVEEVAPKKRKKSA